jgi:hypothetical protein
MFAGRRSGFGSGPGPNPDGVSDHDEDHVWRVHERQGEHFQDDFAGRCLRHSRQGAGDGIGTRGDSVLLFPPKAPKSKATIADERASKGAAGPVTSLADLQAQMAALMALVQAGAVPTGPLVTAPAPAAKRTRKAG